VILPIETKLPMGMDLKDINDVVGYYNLSPGDALSINIRHRRIKIRCRGVWGCCSFTIVGYSVTDLGGRI